ncbi:hypothetical protein GCM10007391_04310 [Alteromonas halophila]|uniref:Uncharacterized protein n=1 Tax=Alteromonas halophila TaxID=516698 RepID=A0A918JDJ2_9ALTE|nr:hypothetical protein GCM10007391_04310 [Alteromonas halophila]
MPVFTALIYTGTHQCLVSQPCADHESFHDYLTEQFGVYVCLWLKEMRAASHTRSK